MIVLREMPTLNASRNVVETVERIMMMRPDIPTIISLRFRHGGDKITNLC